MVVSLVWQLVYYSLTEAETFLLAVVAVLVGLQLGVLWGVTVFVASYFVIRMVGGYVSLIASKLHLLAQVTDKRGEQQ